MLLLWFTAASLARDIPVGPGESVAGATAYAADGDVIVVAEGATYGGTIVLSGPISLTIRSATDEKVDIPSFRISDGAQLRLEHVRAHAMDYTAYVRVGALYDATLTGLDVELTDDGMGGFGILVDPGVIDIDGLESHDMPQVSILEETGTSQITLRNCHFTGSRSGVIKVQDATDGAGGTLTMEDCRIEESGGALLYAEGPTEVRLSRVTYVDNSAVTAWYLDFGATLEADHVAMCGNTFQALLYGTFGTSQTMRRSWLSTGSTATGSAALVYGRGTFEHNTWISTADPDDAVGAVSVFNESSYAREAAITTTNDLYYGFAAWAADSQGAPVGVSHPLWSGGEAPTWITKAPGVIQADPRFVDTFDPDDCDTLPLLTEGSPAIDAGDPDLPLEDGDVDAPDIGAFPFVTEGGGDTDGDGIPDGATAWIMGGGGCATAGGPSAAWLLALLSLRRASGATSRGPGPRPGGPAPRR